MTVRVVVGLEPDADWRKVAERLRAEGAEDVRPPRVSLPDVVVATFLSETDLGELVSRVARLPGVSYAEPDTIQEAFQEENDAHGASASPPTAGPREQWAGTEGGIVQSQES